MNIHTLTMVLGLLVTILLCLGYLLRQKYNGNRLPKLWLLTLLSTCATVYLGMSLWTGHYNLFLYVGVLIELILDSVLWLCWLRQGGEIAAIRSLFKHEQVSGNQKR